MAAQPNRVSWTEKELRLLAEELLVMGHKHDEVGLFHPLGDKAQKAVLPKNRWRNLHNNTATLPVRAIMQRLEAKQPVPAAEAKPSATKIFWREHELRLIAAELLAMGYTHHSGKILPAIREAQTRVLPVERQRPVAGMDGARGVITMMRTLELEHAAMRKPAVEPEPESTGYVPIQDRPIFVEEARTEGVDGLDKLARALGRRIATVMMEEIEARVTELAKGMAVEKLGPSMASWGLDGPVGSIHKFEPTAPRAKKPSVLIAGLLPSQAGYISQEFGEVFDLRFFEASGNLQQLKDMASNVDHAFTFTGKIGHGVEEAIRAKGVEVRRCPGGMTMLREKLTQLFVNGEKEAA